MRKITALVLIGIFLISALSGCRAKINEDEDCLWSPWVAVEEKGESKKTKFVSVCEDCGKERSYKTKPSKGLLYSENEDGTLTVTGIGTCDDEFLYIPVTHNGKKISAIGEGAFDGNMRIKYVYVSGGVKDVGAYAFINCENLLSVTLAEGIEFMGIYAFYECVSMYSFYLPQTVKAIEEFTFSGCFNLREAPVHSNIERIGKAAYSRCSEIKEFILPEGVTNLEEHMFDGCTSLETVDLTGAAGILPESFFAACVSMKSFSVPNTINAIDTNAFIGCAGLEKLYLPESVENIYVREGESPFYMCDKKLTVYCQSSNERVGWQSGYSICNYIEYEDIDKPMEEVHVTFLFGQKNN